MGAFVGTNTPKQRLRYAISVIKWLSPGGESRQRLFRREFVFARRDQLKGACVHAKSESFQAKRRSRRWIVGQSWRWRWQSLPSETPKSSLDCMGRRRRNAFARSSTVVWDVVHRVSACVLAWRRANRGHGLCRTTPTTASHTAAAPVDIGSV